MTKNKKTIVFFNGVYLPHLGGVERYTFELANRLKDAYNIYIVTSNTENLAPISIENGIKIFRLPTRKLLKNRLPSLKKSEEYKALISEIENLEIDHIIINTRFYETTFLGLDLARLKNLTPIIIDHSGGFVLKPYEKTCIKKIKSFSPKFYSVSKTNQKFLKENFNISSHGIFSNAIDSSKNFTKKSNSPVKILFAGRIMKEKGIVDLLEAYRKIKNHVNAELIVAGDGKLLKTLKEKYRGVKFLGKVSHEKTLQLFREADIFVFPTYYREGFPTVLLEAGTNKCAVVIYDDSGGARELVGGKENAALAKQKNIEDLKRKLEQLISDEEYRRSLQENLFARVNEKYTWDKTIAKIKEELEK
ncbi:glycosyltransferase family 4 protein [Candidatus Saccharibacteria bacterium]|nr:glycosyltransferase family 4 protein [Candidatus Saccharibacteria bacterium]